MQKDTVNEGIQTVTLMGIKVTETDYTTGNPLVFKTGQNKGNEYKRVTIWTREYPRTALSYLLNAEMCEWRLFDKLNINITIGGNNLKTGEPYYNFKPVAKAVMATINKTQEIMNEEIAEPITNEIPF